jgi:murein DD-endopeptidase MepM/ murein hydrolase activator NlpD
VLVLGGWLAAGVLLALCLPGEEGESSEAASLLTGPKGLFGRQQAAATAAPLPTATVTPIPSPTPSPMPDGALAEDHFWLARPFSAPENDVVERTYPYGSRGDGTMAIHHGVEMVNPMGTVIHATADGTIVAAGDDLRQVFGARTDYYGLLVIQQLDRTLHGQPVYVLYGHLSEVDVAVGDRVSTGTPLGLVGMSGAATGPHLHLEVRVGRNDYDATANPELWLQPREGRGNLAGLVLTPQGRRVAEVRVVVYAGSTAVAEVLSYPAHDVNSDPARGENLFVGDLAAGDYTAQLFANGRYYSQEFTIVPGRTTWLTFRLAQ